MNYFSMHKTLFKKLEKRDTRRHTHTTLASDKMREETCKKTNNDVVAMKGMNVDVESRYPNLPPISTPHISAPFMEKISLIPVI